MAAQHAFSREHGARSIEIREVRTAVHPLFCFYSLITSRLFFSSLPIPKTTEIIKLESTVSEILLCDVWCWINKKLEFCWHFISKNQNIVYLTYVVCIEYRIQTLIGNIFSAIIVSAVLPFTKRFYFALPVRILQRTYIECK